MRELVVLSGKGGTGKTSVVAAFASLAQNKVLADCDVDAADLHLVLEPAIVERHEFRAGHEAIILQESCLGCGLCLTYCRFGAVLQMSGAEEEPVYQVAAANCKDCSFCVRSCPVKSIDLIIAMREACGETNKSLYFIDPLACEGCGVCVDACPSHAIDFPERVAGEWYLSETRHGPMVHARLGIAAENSGKLVSVVREQARRIAEERDCHMILTDGPPGIGCPVIATLTGASLVLIITEPTLSGQHDLERVAELARHFGVPALVCVNKWDLNPAVCGTIEHSAAALNVRPVGRIRYDRAVTAAQVAGKNVLEFTKKGAADDIRNLWKNIAQILESADGGVEPSFVTEDSGEICY
ncbi:MAG: 4Fe-4S binding protein [Candidatus Hydrogenedentes bacterium]|nr:4Fe-4S binding protein [Candidatus Hydrogenedentota bacterium]